ncbi:MAG: DNA/RNA non-specific endonuclease, partial [Flavobacteriales bacterium]|nr:DNA/RNA non-specific endonuclease [Flavobacteriales bacterium]
MNAKYISAAALIFTATLSLSAQSTPELIEANESRQRQLTTSVDSLRTATDSLRLRYIMERMEDIGWPGGEGELVKHSAMALAYDEEHEMAKWVMHMIIKEVATGRTTRTNDFRVDPKVSTGSTEEIDYFTKEVGDDGKMKYDGYGYDRGHLAASADFRW